MEKGSDTHLANHPAGRSGYWCLNPFPAYVFGPRSMAFGPPSVQTRLGKCKITTMTAMVYLIGAGPGDPGLLTLRGAQRLAAADVVLYDGLSNAELLAHAPSAQHICVGKHGQTRIWRQDEIIAEMIAHARAGKRVARLKGGDPAVFARTSEEVEALQAADIPYELVPGITAALAAGSFAGIPITHRGIASAVALVTGHEEPTKTASALDWDALAQFPGTLVIYMGVTTAPTWTRGADRRGQIGRHADCDRSSLQLARSTDFPLPPG